MESAKTKRPKTSHDYPKRTMTTQKRAKMTQKNPKTTQTDTISEQEYRVCINFSDWEDSSDYIETTQALLLFASLVSPENV